ncbi:hypothetical protein SERLA73DRAFT_183323 [Serpula lacrymans var. lacrymans S7.3]|uniref:FHA domain-containing protein n=1 Tax=Serpula lacrymans var. lacrymans (strain S7.3) TaxID=936435 RepID=F8PZP0_SERL3|nr:hypothetical protein SERLA73DRAFT_183323 [Serpula lacrymans var. lacrymans S7.3]
MVRSNPRSPPLSPGPRSNKREDNYYRRREQSRRGSEEGENHRRARYNGNREDERRDNRRRRDYGRRDDEKRDNDHRGQDRPSSRRDYPDRDRRERDSGRERARDPSNRDSRAGPSRRSASPRSRPPRPRSASPPVSKSPSSVNKAKPNFSQSGLLAADTNTVKAADGTSTILKYNEPPEARKPHLGWRLYVFKDGDEVELLHIHRQSAYLIGRDRSVADIAIEHPSCSKQHAVIQHRQVQEKNEFGESKPVIKPFIIDLESTNGTHVNDEPIPASRFYELKPSDVIKFGLSTREYVLLHDEAT